MVIRRKGKRGWAVLAAESVRNIVVGDDGDGPQLLDPPA